MLIKKKLLLTVLFSLGVISQGYAFNTQNGRIYDDIGNEIAIDGVAWIGFQDSNFLGGLWNVAFNPIGSQHGVMELLKAPWTVPGSNVTSPDNGVSFKAIRLPIQPGIWGTANTAQSTPFDFSRTSVSNPTAGNGPFCDWTAGSDASGHCIKSKTAPNLLTAAINEFDKQNVLVMLDFHHRPGLGDNFRDGTVVAANYTLKNYYDDIVNFAKTAPKNILGIDIYNEPHKLFWYNDNTQAAQPSWIKVIAAAAAALYNTNQKILLFVEGPGGTAGNDAYDPVYNLNRRICLPNTTKVDDTTVIGLANDPTNCNSSVKRKLKTVGVNTMRVTNIGVNWGENFRALLDPVQAINGVASFDVKTFRAMLIQAITANNFNNTDPNLIADWLLGKNNDGNQGHLAFAPHLYGKQVGGWQSDANDSQIRFKWNFGFLFDAGFPVVIGELGYDVQMPQSGGEDFFVNSVAPYLLNKKINHNLFFWTWNHDDYPEGVRANDSDLSLFAWKEKDLHDLFNANVLPPTFGKLCVTVPTPTGYSGSTLPTITATGSNSYVFNIAQFDVLTCQNNVATGNYNLTGSSLSDPSGIKYVPAEIYAATVGNNTETDVTVQYIKEPTGTLQLNVSGDSNCAIDGNQQFTVTYTKDSVTKQTTVTSATPVNVNLPIGNYMINVTPDPLPTNQLCKANYNKTASVTDNNTTQESIKYIFTNVQTCSVDAYCTTWGTPNDSWAGSSCNFFIRTQTGMTKPTNFTFQAIGITDIVQPGWGATIQLTNGNVVMDLTDPVNNNNVGFNAKGIITLPSQSTLTTKGQTMNCPIVKHLK